jgi:hypothetical protein
MREWQHRDPNLDRVEILVGTEVICLNLRSGAGEVSSGPFYSSFTVEGETPEERKVDAIREAYAVVKRHLAEFEANAAEMGITLT